MLVDEPEGLERLLEDLAGQDEIAVDTEADSFFHYRERVCLIQITVEDRDYLVDPLRDLDLGGIGDVLADPAKTKVFHDGEYDVLIMKREYGFRFRGLFDTRIAAAALGAEQPGLAAVIGERFGVELDKSLQRSNWSNRPLSDRQIDYARLDTHYLIPLMHAMREQLALADRTIVVEGECRRLEELEPPPRAFDPDEFVRIKGARNLRPQQLSALRELFVLRDELARERDLPPFKVLGNPALLAVAQAQPTTPGQLARVEDLSPRVARRIGPGILAAIARAKEAGPIKKLPQLRSRDGTGELDEDAYELHERLKVWRKRKALEENMDASLILNRLVLLRLAMDAPRDARALAKIDGLQEWQRERYGADLLDVVGGFADDQAAGRVGQRPRRRSRRDP
jgi:ribonuclease D